jgi:alpha-ribazole phosphatase
MNVILIRHTSVACLGGICYGRTEVPLADSFDDEAAAVRAALPPPPWYLVSSPVIRCRRLADFLSSSNLVDERLHELNFGAWENRLWAELPRENTEWWLADFVNRHPPGGESFGELALRTRAALEDHVRAAAGATALLVTHAAVIRALLAHGSGMSLRDAFSIPVPFGSISRLSLFDHPSGASQPGLGPIP